MKIIIFFINWGWAPQLGLQTRCKRKRENKT